MTPAFSARHADDFEALLSRGPDDARSAADAERYAALLDVVAELRALPEVAPRPEFVGSLRERLMAEADTALVRQPPAPERRVVVTSRRRQRLVAALLGGAVLAGSTATVAVAAQSALPGESLYGVKRGIESAQVRFAGDDSARGRMLLAQADVRLSELEDLAAGQGGNDRLIPATLDRFTEQSGDGVRSLLTAYDASAGADADLQQARTFTATSLERLDALEGQLPESARESLLAAGRTLSDLDIEVSTACPVCDGGIVTVPEFLLTGAPVDDLLSGLDADDLTLEAAPISGQDLTGITVPEQLQPSAQPTQGQPTQGVPTTNVPTQTPPTSAPTSLPTSLPTTPQPTKSPTETVTDLTDDLTDTVTGTTGTLTNTLDDVTGGALGGLTTGLDDATGGLIGEVTGTVDGVTGGLLGNATGGLLP